LQQLETWSASSKAKIYKFQIGNGRIAQHFAPDAMKRQGKDVLFEMEHGRIGGKAPACPRERDKEGAPRASDGEFISSSSASAYVK
jgi:hypothetical protein